MTMNGIDISNFQNGISLATIKYDFMIAKATEGIGYVDPCCDKFMQACFSLGKCAGFYHFARPVNDATAEANFFYENTKGYFGKAIPILDWEAENKHDVAWAKTWLDRVYTLSGVKPMIYMSESVVNAYDWSSVVAGDYGLWVAKYRDNNPDYNYDMSNAGTVPSVKHWNGYAMWQWTSSGRLDGYNGNLDCDVFYGDSTAWNKYAHASESSNKATGATKTTQTVKPSTPAKKSNEEIANEVIAGKWGNDPVRSQKLTQAGYDPKAIQAIVNKHYNVNSAPQATYYTIQSGDNLYSIASKYGTTIANIQKLNSSLIKNVNYIQAGWKIRVK